MIFAEARIPKSKSDNQLKGGFVMPERDPYIEGGMPPTSWALACGFRSFAGTLEELGGIGSDTIRVAISCTQSLTFDRDVNTAIIGLRPFALDVAGAEVYQKGALVRVNIRTPDNTALSVEAVFTDVRAND